MITAAADFFGTILGKFALGGGIIASFFAWLLLHDHKIKVEAKNATVANIERASDEAAAKATKARRAVDAIPDSRLRDRYFRD